MNELLSKKRDFLRNGKSIDSSQFQDATKQILKDCGIRNEISGRFDWLLVFNTLDARNVAKIALQEIRKLASKYNLKINSVDTALLSEMGDTCKDNNEGARPVRRIVKATFNPIFQDYSENNTFSENEIFDIDEKKNLVQSSSHTLLSIDEIVNDIDFEVHTPIQNPEILKITLPSHRHFIDNSVDSYAKALGIIKIDNGQAGEGTGFLISPNGYIITCAHCIVNGKRISFCYNGEDIETMLIYKNEKIDIAIIKIERGNLPYFIISDSTRGLKRGIQMGLLAYPQGSTIGTKPSYTSGAIAKCEDGMYFTDANATHGSSGGAFFKIDDGVVYGILKGGFGANINIATDILTLFKQQDIEIEFE